MRGHQYEHLDGPAGLGDAGCLVSTITRVMSALAFPLWPWWLELPGTSGRTVWCII